MAHGLCFFGLASGLRVNLSRWLMRVGASRQMCFFSSLLFDLFLFLCITFFFFLCHDAGIHRDRRVLVSPGESFNLKDFWRWLRIEGFCDVFDPRLFTPEIDHVQVNSAAGAVQPNEANLVQKRQCLCKFRLRARGDREYLVFDPEGIPYVPAMVVTICHDEWKQCLAEFCQLSSLGVQIVKFP